MDRAPDSAPAMTVATPEDIAHVGDDARVLGQPLAPRGIDMT